MHAGKSGESTPAATKGRRRLGHRLPLWSVPDNVTTSTCTVNDHPVCAASEASRLFLTGAATPPVPGGERPVLAIHSHLLSTWSKRPKSSSSPRSSCRIKKTSVSYYLHPASFRFGQMFWKNSAKIRQSSC